MTGVAPRSPGDRPSHLAALLRHAAAAAPSAPFLTDLRTAETWSYGDLAAGAGHLAGLLAQQGVAPGDRVVFLTRNDPVFVPLLFACALTGTILVPLNRDSLAAEIDTIVADAKPVLVLHDARHPPAGRRSLPVAWRTDEPPPAATPVPTPTDDVLIVYTSGTTGNAKGVVLSHRNLLAMAGTFAGVYGFRPGQRFLSMLPFFHINAPMITGLACITAGAHVHLTDLYGFTNARTIFDLVEAHRINVLSLTPSIMASLVQLNPAGTPRDLSSLEFCLCGTAALGERLWREFETLAKAPVYQGYGLTETTTWATLTPPDARKRYDSAGVPIGCEVRIDGSQSGDKGTGEILIKGDIVTSGYFNKKKLTRASLRNGWYHSGDVGRIDADGQLVIVGRTKNIIKRRGVLIHPEAIDDCLRQSGAVAESCTVGVPDRLAGERVVTACVLDGGTVAELRAHLAARLSPDMRPDEIVPIHAIPRNSLGKALTNKVRDLVSGDAAERVIQAFSQGKFRRAPSDRIDEIRATIRQALLSGTPISFVGFWGVGPRRDAAEPDHSALARLGEVRREMDEALGHPQAAIELLFTDTHGRCNRFPDAHMDHYFGQIAALAEAEGLSTRRLSDVWRAAGMDEGEIERRAADPATARDWKTFALRDDFVRQAEKRCGRADWAEDYAFRYYCTCVIERGLLTQALAGTLFFTYNAPKFGVVLPDLPTVYWHSTKPGTAVKPWFQ